VHRVFRNAAALFAIIKIAPSTLRESLADLPGRQAGDSEHLLKLECATKIFCTFVYIAVCIFFNHCYRKDNLLSQIVLKVKTDILRFITLLLAVVLPFAASGQIGLTYPYFLNSSDGAYYLKSIPHASQMHYAVGRTEVYRTMDSSMVYQIEKYLAPDGVVLSNDGQSILYARSEMTLSSIDSTAVLELFRNGQVLRSYHFTDLLEKDQEMYYQGLFSSLVPARN